MKSHNGFYKLDNLIFSNKFSAILKASKTKKQIDWIFYNDIFERACLNFRSYDISLKEIYKKRAQQLRDQYEYLILNYSGGSDSHNILSTFLENNIKLDHLYIQWPLSLVDKSLYMPNSIDKSNFNFCSEWDLVIKEDLKWISQKHPSIKIEISDWSLNIKENFYSDILYQKDVTNLPSIARSQKQNTFSEEESKLSNLGVKVGSIYGVDKPFIAIKNDIAYFRFADTTLMAQPNPENPNGLEYFYFTPNMPEIPILQTYNLFQFYKKNLNKLYIVSDKEYRKTYYPDTLKNHWYTDLNDYNEIFKLVCYPYWNFNRFQADKPFSVLEGLPMGVRAWDNILVKSIPDFGSIQQKWQYLWISYLNEIDKEFLTNRDTIKSIYSKWYKPVFN